MKKNNFNDKNEINNINATIIQIINDLLFKKIYIFISSYNKYTNSLIRLTKYAQKVHVYLKIAIIRPCLLLLVIAANNSNVTAHQ